MINGELPPRSDGFRALGAWLVLIAIVVAFFASLEFQRPYFFLQDDNRDYFLPAFVHNVRAATDGQLAEYNFHQSLGRPHLSVGQTSTLHPLPYLAVFLSDAVLGHPFAAIEFLTLFYFLIGAGGMMAAGRAMGFPHVVALFLAVSWALLPFHVHVSQSWAIHAPLVAFLPWMIHGVLVLGRRRSAVAQLVLVNLLFFYTGYPQLFLYAALFQAPFLAGVLASPVGATREDMKPALARYLLVWALSAVLMLPLVMPMWGQIVASVYRSEALGFHTFRDGALRFAEYVNGTFFPFARLYDIPEIRLFLDQVPASFTHLGYAVLALIVIHVIAGRRHTLPARRRLLDVSLGLGIVGILWATGVLSPLLYWIPVLNRFRWPFKTHAFAAFFLLFIAAAGLDWILRRRWRWSRAAVIAILAFQTTNLWFLDLRFPKHGFLEHLDPVPLQEPLADELRTGRYISIGYEAERPRVFTAPTLGFNYATLWGLQGFGGYEPLVSVITHKATLKLDYEAVLSPDKDRIPLPYLRLWGVRWYIVNRPWNRVHGPQLEREGLVLRNSDAHRLVFEDPFAAPLVYAVRGECTPRWRLTYPGDDVETTVECRTDADLVISFLNREGLSVWVNGESAPVTATAFGRLVVNVPAGRHTVRVEYHDSLLDLGFWLSFVGVLVTAVIALAIRARGVRRRGSRADPASADAG